MNRYASHLLRRLARGRTPETGSAHCDVPCGIYDPHAAQIGALTVLRMNQLMGQVDPAADKAAANSYTRYVATKESHAEVVKKELDILWHDYFKPEHLATVPNLHDLFWQANKQVSKVKASTDLADARKLLELIDEVDAAWKATGGEEKTRVNGRPS